MVTEACCGLGNTLLDSLLLFGFWNQVSQIHTTNIIFLVCVLMLAVVWEPLFQYFLSWLALR